MWTGVALQPVSGTSLKEVVTGSPPVGRTLSSVPEWSSFLEREMVRLMICGKQITHTHVHIYVYVYMLLNGNVSLENTG